MTRRYCRHCDTDRTAYRTNGGLCMACRNYLRKYHKLPSAEVLIRRQERRDQHRHETQIPPPLALACYNSHHVGVLAPPPRAQTPPLELLPSLPASLDAPPA